MNLQEAIQHCLEKAQGCNECAEEHRQLADWLIELLEYRQFHNGVLRDGDVLRAAKSIKSWCIAHFDRDGCEDCPFYNTNVRTKCMVSPNRDPWEWKLVRHSREG